MSYPKVAFSGIEDFERNTDSWVLGVVKSSDTFRCMGDERAFNSRKTHDNCLKVNQIRFRTTELASITFFEVFSPTSLRVSEANGIGDNSESYKRFE